MVRGVSVHSKNAHALDRNHCPSRCRCGDPLKKLNRWSRARAPYAHYMYAQGAVCADGSQAFKNGRDTEHAGRKKKEGARDIVEVGQVGAEAAHQVGGAFGIENK